MTAFWIVLAAAVAVAVITLALILRARRPRRERQADADKRRDPGRRQRPAAALGGALAALRYLTTRREWRYAVPWIIAIGEAGGGKTSLAASITSGRRQNLLLRERKLVPPGSKWSFFDRGVLIDPGQALETGADDDIGWQRFLDRIDHHRPERPLDGVVLTLSARSLLRADSAALQSLAESCYRQLWSLQKHFSFALPVYVTITQCDAIPGFTAFWGAAATGRNQMIGWASPYQPTHEFSRTQVGDAFDQIGRQLKALQLCTAAGSRLDDPDNFFLFPVRLRALRAPLETVLEQVFRRSGYHAAFPCRGIWLTGSVAANGRRAAEPRTDVDFVDDLFDQKVFAERNLATPTRSGVWSRNRSIRRLQIGGALGFAALLCGELVGAWQLNSQVDNVAHSLSLLRTAERESDRTDGCAGSRSIYDLLTHVARIDSSLTYVTIPASWFDYRVSQRTADTIAEHAFERIVFPSLACHLNARRAALAEFEPQFESEPDPGREMDRRRAVLVDYVARLREYERFHDLFENLRVGSPEGALPRLLEDLNELAIYLYGDPLPPGVRQPEGDHLAALARVEYDGQQPTTALRAPASRAIRSQLRSVAAATRRLVAEGQGLVNDIEQEDGPARPRLQRLSWWFDWVGGEWLGATPDTNACTELTAALTPDLKTLVHGFGYPLDLDEALSPLAAERCHRPAIEALKSLRLPPTGPAFRAGDEGLVLTDAASGTVEGLRHAIGLPFMQLTGSPAFRCDTPLRAWDPSALAEAVNHLRAFREFATRTPDAAPGKALYISGTARHLNRVLDGILNEAQITASLAEETDVVQPVSASESRLRRTSHDLARAVDDFLFVLRQYRQLGFEPAYSRVVQCVRGFAHDNLLAIDSLAAQSRLYGPGVNDTALGNERSDDAPPVPLFDLGSEAATKDYLKRQIERSRVLAGYATPFVTVLGNTEAINDGALLPGQSDRYWRGTIRELNRHIQFKAPDSDVAVLHQLVQEDLRPLTDANCADRIGSLSTFARNNDLFAQRGRHLTRQAQLYCGDVKRAVAYDGYRTLAERFNHELAAGFPFDAADEDDAPLVTTRRFFRALADNPDAIRRYAQTRAQRGDPRYQAFVDALQAGIDFFRLNLAAPDAVAPVHVDTIFRLERELSVGSDQLVRWAVGNGSSTSVFPNGERTLDWRFGQPLLVRADWAEGSDVRPVADPEQPDMQVDGNRVTWRVDGEWALLRMIERHGARQIPPRDPLGPNRLRLEFNVPTAPRDGSSGASRTTTLFLELQLQGTDPETGKTVPAVPPPGFPAQAPLD